MKTSCLRKHNMYHEKIMKYKHSLEHKGSVFPMNKKTNLVLRFKAIGLLVYTHAQYKTTTLPFNITIISYSMLLFALCLAVLHRTRHPCIAHMISLCPSPMHTSSSSVSHKNSKRLLFPRRPTQKHVCVKTPFG